MSTKSWLPELCCRLYLKSKLQAVLELQSICWCWLNLLEKSVQMTQKITTRLTLGSKMAILMFFTVIENIPDLEIWLLTGIWLSSADLLSFVFSLFFERFPRFFLCFRIEKVFWFHILLTSRSLTSFDVIFHDLIVTRRAIIYGHTWGLDQQKHFFERPTMEF